MTEQAITEQPSDPAATIEPGSEAVEEQTLDLSTPAGPPSRPPVLVLGMHRSGTSAVAGALCRLGGWVGDDDELMPADAANATGYYERLETAAELDAMLTALGGSWLHPPIHRLTRYRLEAVRPALAALLRSLEARTPSERFLVVKDPRLSLLTALLSPLAPEADIVVCVRHPLASARSLSGRDGVNLLHSLALWEAYNVALCAGLEDRAVHLHLFDGSTASELPAFVTRVLGPLCAADTELGLDAEHMHQSVTAEDECQWLTLGQQRLWHRLRELAGHGKVVQLPQQELSAASAHILAP